MQTAIATTPRNTPMLPTMTKNVNKGSPSISDAAAVSRSVPGGGGDEAASGSPLSSKLAETSMEPPPDKPKAPRQPMSSQ